MFGWVGGRIVFFLFFLWFLSILGGGRGKEWKFSMNTNNMQEIEWNKAMEDIEYDKSKWNREVIALPSLLELS